MAGAGPCSISTLCDSAASHAALHPPGGPGRRGTRACWAPPQTRWRSCRRPWSSCSAERASRCQSRPRIQHPAGRRNVASLLLAHPRTAHDSQPALTAGSLAPLSPSTTPRQVLSCPRARTSPRPPELQPGARRSPALPPRMPPHGAPATPATCGRAACSCWEDSCARSRAHRLPAPPAGARAGSAPPPPLQQTVAAWQARGAGCVQLMMPRHRHHPRHSLPTWTHGMRSSIEVRL